VLYEADGRCCQVRLGRAELRLDGASSRELADRPGLRVVFTLGEVRLYDLLALGLVGVVRLLAGAPRVELRVWLRLALGLEAVLALRPDWVGAERPGDAAKDRLERPGDAAVDWLLGAPL